MKCLIFVPTFNEAGNVEALFRSLQKLEIDADYLFVDDNSPDGTGEILDRLAAECPRVHAAHRAGKLGIGSAHAEGIRWAYDRGYDTLITMDCDFTHPPDRIPDLLRRIGEHDVVIGSRYIRADSIAGWTFIRRFLTRLGHFLTRTLLGMPYDATGAFRVYRLDRIQRGIFDLVYSRSYSFFFESLYILWLNGCSIGEVPVQLPARANGRSKLAWRDAFYSLLLLVYLYLKTAIGRDALLYAPPFAPAGEAPGAPSSPEWNDYWVSKKEPTGLLYDLIAGFYRKFIIRPCLNHFALKYFPRGAEVLHAGCGSGEVDTDVRRHCDVSALDISPPALGIYRKHHGEAAHLIHGSIFEIPSPADAYGGVYNLGVMEHFTEPEIKRILDEFHRVLKPGGSVLLFWPPVFGLSVRVLAVAHWILRRASGRMVKLHPDELTHVRSRKQVERYLAASGLTLEEFYFGFRDFFTHAVVVARKGAAGRSLAARPTISSAPSV